MKIVMPLFIALACCWQLARHTAPERTVQVASLYVGHQEVTTNRSHQIDYWNARLNLPMGSNYCASFCRLCARFGSGCLPSSKKRGGTALYHKPEHSGWSCCLRQGYPQRLPGDMEARQYLDGTCGNCPQAVDWYWWPDYRGQHLPGQWRRSKAGAMACGPGSGISITRPIFGLLTLHPFAKCRK